MRASRIDEPFSYPSVMLADAPRLWLVEAYTLARRQLAPKLFQDQDSAMWHVHDNLVQRAAFNVALQDGLDDDHEAAPGTITALTWRCPLRPMTRAEVEASDNPFKDSWLASGNYPNVDDVDAARQQGVRFLTKDHVTWVHVCRLSRHLGYLERSGRLNDKRKDAKHIIAEWKRFKAL